jgi:hypothetical protein
MQIEEINNIKDYDKVVYNLGENLSIVLNQLFNIEIEIKDGFSLEDIGKLFEENNIPVDSHAGMYNIVESLHRSNLSMWGESNRLWCIIQSVWFHGNQMGQKHATLGDLDYKAEYYKLLDEQYERSQKAFKESVENCKLEQKYLNSLKRSQELLNFEDEDLNEEIRVFEEKINKRNDGINDVIDSINNILEE